MKLKKEHICSVFSNNKIKLETSNRNMWKIPNCLEINNTYTHITHTTHISHG